MMTDPNKWFNECNQNFFFYSSVYSQYTRNDEVEKNTSGGGP